MSQELLNTSAPRGVKPGSTGFCTVGLTAGMSSALEERLSLLSGYRWLVPPGEKGAENNPVAYAHWRMSLGARTVNVLSRVCDAGFDYSRRSNRFAHHVVLDAAEQSEAGPAWLMLHGGIMRSSFPSEPEVFPAGPQIPAGVNPPHVCEHWNALAGDAGWAGVLTQSFAADPARTAYIIYSPGMEMLPLIDEALALLPPAMRWRVTFSTYFSDLPAGMSCAWRCCVAGTKAATEAPRHATSGVIIDLTRPPGPAPENPATTAARTGTELPIAAAPEPEAGQWTGPVSNPGAFAELREPTPSQSWMTPPVAKSGLSGMPGMSAPPMVATPSAAAKPKKEKRRSMAVFWIISLLWPVGAGGGVLWYFNSRKAPTAASPSGPATNHLPGGPSPNISDSGDLQQKAMHEKLTKVETELKAKADAHSDVVAKLATAEENLLKRSGIVTQLEADKKALLEDQKKKADEIESLKAKSPAVTTKLVQAPPHIVEWPVEIFKSEFEIWPGDGGAPPDGVKLEGYLPQVQEVDIVPNSQSLKLFIRAEPERKLLATIHCRAKSGAVIFTWADNWKKQLDDKASVRAWLKMCQITVKRQGGVLATRSLYTGVEAFEMVVDKNQVSKLLVDDTTPDSRNHVRLLIPKGSPDGWRITGSTGGPEQAGSARALHVECIKCTDAAFDIEWDANKGFLKTTGEMLGDKSTELGNLAVDIKRHTEAAKNARDKAANLRLMKVEAAEEKKHKAEIDAEDEKAKTADKALATAEANKKRIEGALKELEKLPEFKIQLCNDATKMVLCSVTIKQKPKETPAVKKP